MYMYMHIHYVNVLCRSRRPTVAALPSCLRARILCWNEPDG